MTTEEEEKGLFAVYLNMARQNAFTTLSHISKLTGGESGSEARLSEMTPIQVLTQEDALPEIREKTLALLDKHFPFLRPMINQEKVREKRNQALGGTGRPSAAVQLSTPEMYHKILVAIFETLNDHAQREATPFSKDLIPYMKGCFDGAVRVAKERLNLADKDVRHLSRFEGRPRITYDKARPVKKYEEDAGFHYKFDDKAGEITPKGLAFFTCLFLERKYANLFLSQMSSFTRSGERGVDDSARVTRAVFSIYSIRLPKLRVDSESSVMTLGVDMLNELKKCPAELLEHLEPEAQKRFQVTSDEAQPDDDGPQDTILLKRFKNRFPQLALSYIDRQQLFPTVRFQVELGAYRYKFYSKTGVDRRARVRILQKPLHGFGRLQEVEERRKLEWKDKIRPFEATEKDHADTKPYVTDTHAHYIVANNRVGMYWDASNDAAAGNYLPALKDDGAESQAPLCWLSIYELPAMIFHALLCSTLSATQDVIRDYATRYRRLFSDIMEEKLSPSADVDVRQVVEADYGIKFSQIPDEIRSYLSGGAKDVERKFVELAKARIQRMIKSTQGRRRKIENDIAATRDSKRNKVGKKRYVEIKSGVLADFLAEDLLLFQPTQAEGKDKLTGVNYQVLQATLACYGRHTTEMRQIFTSCKLLNSPIAHPFLGKVMERTHGDIVSFYQSYLSEREKYLSSLQEKDYTRYHFLHANRDRWQPRSAEYYRQLAKRHLSLPIELPRGLFKEALRALSAQQTESPEVQKAIQQDHFNTVYLVQTYFKTAFNDGRQAFYDLPRSYKLLDTLNGKLQRNKLEQTFYTTAELTERLKSIDKEIEQYVERQCRTGGAQPLRRQPPHHLQKPPAEKDDKAAQLRTKLTHLRNELDQNEKTLRLTQVQDMLLFWMAKKLLIDSQPSEIRSVAVESYKLRDVKPDGEKDTLPV
jgi:hypothetical protein